MIKILQKGKPSNKPGLSQSLPEDIENQPIDVSLSNNQKVLNNIFNNCTDIIYREFNIGKDQTSVKIIFVQGLVDEKIVNGDVMKSLMELQNSFINSKEPDNLFEAVKQTFLKAGIIEELPTFGKIADAILNGDTVFLIEGADKALKIGTVGWKFRDVSEPVTEGVVRGPREGFTENLRTNTSLLRRKIKSHELKFEKYILGRVTKTEVNISYLANVVDEMLVKEIKKRIAKIDVDSILESAYIEELIEDEPFTLFPQIEHSERPDKIAAAILEGRVGILVDGTPFALLVPTVMPQFMQSSEDYYERYPFAFLVRTVRYIFLIFALLLPAIYIAVVNYHQEMIPTPLLISIIGANQGVPFPSFVETLIMEVTFEALREAGVRLPRPVGQAVSIVGGIVIGQAAVQAGIVSAPVVIVVALTGISSFAVPAYNFTLAIRILRFVYMLLAATSGFYGIMLGIMVLLFHLVSLRSFGVPYFSPFAPFKLKNFKDVFIRTPWWMMSERPGFLNTLNRRRQKFFLKPKPPESNNK